MTPPRWGQAASGNLSHSFWILFQAEAHGVFTDACAATMVNAFFRAPAVDPSAQCPNRAQDVVFAISATRAPTTVSLAPVDLGALRRRLRHPIR